MHISRAATLHASQTIQLINPAKRDAVRPPRLAPDCGSPVPAKGQSLPDPSDLSVSRRSTGLRPQSDWPDPGEYSESTGAMSRVGAFSQSLWPVFKSSLTRGAGQDPCTVGGPGLSARDVLQRSDSGLYFLTSIVPQRLTDTTGYVFESASAIQPHLETPRTGPTSRFAADLARRLECYVVAGYPELITPEEAERHFARTSRRVVGANSAVLCDPQGEWVGGYRKTNLFHVDETWALPGTGFGTFHLPPPLHTVALGICMDLNAQPPHDWTITHGPFELAAHCLETRANVLVLLNAWLDSGRAGEEESDMLTMNFWAERLRPLWVPNSVPSDPNPGNSESGERPETIVVVANRTGTEKGTTFAGSSAVFKMRRGGGKKGILRAALGRDEEDVMIWDDIAGC